MTRLPTSPSVLPGAIDALLSQLADAWAGSEIRPKVPADISAHWDALIEECLASKDLPLFVRRWGRAEARGQIVQHISGRQLVPSDNTLANWVFVQAYAGMRRRRNSRNTTMLMLSRFHSRPLAKACQ